jgi:hypothetical protein
LGDADPEDVLEDASELAWEAACAVGCGVGSDTGDTEECYYLESAAGTGDLEFLGFEVSPVDYQQDSEHSL